MSDHCGTPDLWRKAATRIARQVRMGRAGLEPATLGLKVPAFSTPNQAFDNDAFERARPQRLVSTRGPRLRRLAADTQLLRRRAAGESLRSLAADYDVDHTTLVRFFARAEIRELLRTTVHELRADRRAETSVWSTADDDCPRRRIPPAGHPRKPRALGAVRYPLIERVRRDGR
jgi:hypothetical protein